MATTTMAPATAHPVVAAPVPVVPTTPPAPPLLDADGLATRIAAAGSDSPDAWRSLLASWELPTDPPDIAIAMQCAPLLAPDVHCLRARATLDKLAAIGRPVLLRLRSGGHDAWAELLGVGALRVRLQLAGSVVEAPRVSLQRAWKGEYVSVWRSPATPVALPPDIMALRRFQSDHGLVADGVAGPETGFALAADAAGPRLARGVD
jgi:general secretion pathway protein A